MMTKWYRFSLNAHHVEKGKPIYQTRIQIEMTKAEAAQLLADIANDLVYANENGAGIAVGILGVLIEDNEHD